MAQRPGMGSAVATGGGQMKYSVAGVTIDADKWIRITRSCFLLIVAISVLDILTSTRPGREGLHLLQDSALCVLTSSLIVILFLNDRAQRQRNEKLLLELEAARVNSTRASEQLIDAKRAFGEEIARQFSSWGLTRSEADIALLTLKGFTAKEIAGFRGVSEKTVRNQLTCIYRKSGTTGKMGFIAWFMEDLL
jgi:DNA-binding CsgD family transcriptional regulator